MEVITLGQIGAGVALIFGIIKFIEYLYNLLRKSTLDKIDKNSKAIEELKAEVGWLKSEMQDDKEERIIILQGLLACLKGLQEQGCDGAVTESISKIEDYLMKKSHD